MNKKSKRDKLSKKLPHKKKENNLFPQNCGIKSGLYVIQSLENSCTYVGESGNVTARLTAHKNSLRKGNHSNGKLQKDWNTYGENRFVFKKLQFGFGADREKRFFFETTILNTLSPNIRYNTYTNWRTRGKESNPFFNRKHTPEARAALSLVLSGRESSFLHRTHTDEVKKIISQHNSGGGNRKKVVFIDDEFYESVTEAWKVTGLSRVIIRKYCNSNEARYDNFRWGNSEILDNEEKSLLATEKCVVQSINTLADDLVLESQEIISSQSLPHEVQKLVDNVVKEFDKLFELPKLKDPKLKREVVKLLQSKLINLVS